jgi:hypothetical protein
MALLHHDTTGTQTDCPRPLSRKKLRSLCNQNRNNLTNGSLTNPKNPAYISGRHRGPKCISTQDQKIKARAIKAGKKARQKARAKDVQLPGDTAASR